MIHLIFDTETTGLPKQYNAPMSDINNWPRLVQLSFIISDGNDSREFDFIIKPDGFEISKEATDIHGISQEQAMNDGVKLEYAMAIFRAMVNVADVIVAHNITFDRAIVGAEYYRLGIGKSFEERLAEKEQFCTMQKTTDMCKIPSQYGGNKWPKLIELYKHMFNEEFSGAHNSMVDTRACAKCYFELIKNK